MILTIIQFFSYMIPTLFGTPVTIIFVICKNIYIQTTSLPKINQSITETQSKQILAHWNIYCSVVKCPYQSISADYSAPKAYLFLEFIISECYSIFSTHNQICG